MLRQMARWQRAEDRVRDQRRRDVAKADGLTDSAQLPL